MYSMETKQYFNH